jgi:CO/xanthine dehydrogenase FAD-binding subunit
MDLNTVQSLARPGGRDEIPAWQVGDAWLAGGTWLYSEPQPRLTRLIDLGALGWEPLRVTPQGLEIAATCKIAALDALTPPLAWAAAPLIGQCCRAFLASFKIWNMASVGGNLCMALPAGPMIALCVALDGVATIWQADGGERQMPVIDFVLGPQRNALRPGELLRRIDLPAAALARRTAFRQISLARLGRSGVLAIGTRDPANGAFALTVTAATPAPKRFSFAQMPTGEALLARLADELPLAAFYDDLHGQPAWRRHMALHFAQDIHAELAGARAP